MADFLEIAQQAAVGAGKLVRAHLNDDHVLEKKGMFDFVTETDRLSETYIRRQIGEAFPEHNFFCEEQVSGGGRDEDELLRGLSGYTWIVDALDGTTNFIRGIPQFAVSIALACDGDLLVGAVYDPNRDELFSARKGKGAWVNGQPMRVSRIGSLGSAIVSVGFPAADMAKRAQTMEMIGRLAPKIGSLRVYNCAALLLSYVAAGRTDLSFELGLHLWDMAAGVLMVREAGGDATYMDGRAFDLFSRENFAGNHAMRRLASSWMRCAPTPEMCVSSPLARGSAT